jgi:hypothetical protein
VKVLFDQNVPMNLRRYLIRHTVRTAYQMRWDRAVNRELLKVAEDAGFDVFVTGNQNLSYQQNLVSRRNAIVELTRNHWPAVLQHLNEVVAAVNASSPGSYIRVICGR